MTSVIRIGGKNVKDGTNLHLRRSIKVFFYRTHFHETQNRSRILRRHFVCLIAPDSLRNVEITDRSLFLS